MREKKRMSVLTLLMGASQVMAQEEMLWEVPTVVTPARYEQLITDAHRGEIMAESKVDHGTTFIVRLPIKAY
jgi:hypothetical protein